MKTAKLFAIAAGLSALSACNVTVNENNSANAEATDTNAADASTPPADANMGMNADTSIGTTNDVENDSGAMNNSASNTANSY